MNHPAKAFDEIRENFILYMKTAFKTQFPSLETEREELLRGTSPARPGTFTQEPWIEPLPRYAQTGRLDELTAAQLPTLQEEDIQDLAEFAHYGLIQGFPLYEHQLTMLQLALAGRNAVVTAGTGSGKTESFMLPLLASLLQESRSWVAPRDPALHQHDWWLPSQSTWCESILDAGTSCRIPQRSSEQRRAAVRALVLYPMNALVEDQLTRLRKTFDCEASRSWMQRHRQGNLIYFGRYNSGTPVPGHEYEPNGRPNRRKIEELRTELQAADQAQRSARAHALEGDDDEVPFFFPSLSGAEMRCRWDMQAHHQTS